MSPWDGDSKYPIWIGDPKCPVGMETPMSRWDGDPKCPVGMETPNIPLGWRPRCPVGFKTPNIPLGWTPLSKGWLLALPSPFCRRKKKRGMKEARPSSSRILLPMPCCTRLFVCPSVCPSVRGSRAGGKQTPPRRPPASDQAPGEGKEAWRGTHYCSAPANARGTQDKQEGELRFPVFVLQIFSLRRFFLILSPGLFASNKGKESSDCRHPLGPHYFPIITASGRTRRAILLLQTLHFHLSFTLFSPHSTPTSPPQAPSPATGAEMGLGALNCSGAESM